MFQILQIIVEENEHSSSFNESNWTKNVTLHHSNDHDKSLVNIINVEL
jgi:hypothetical protein